MKVYLINMPFNEQEYTKFSEKWDYIEDEYIGINIIYALLRNHGVYAVKSTRSKIADMVADVFSGQYDTVMISAMQTSASLSYKFINFIRSEGYKGTIFIGGWYPKLAWKYIFENHWPVDYVCYVDAEDVFPKWISNPHSYIPGIATYENYHQQILLSQEDIRSQNTWPESYCSPVREPGRRTYRLETSRGCPHAHCTFCSLSCADVIKDKWRPLSKDIILGEIEKIHTLYGVTRFSLTDDDMLGPIEGAERRAKDLLEWTRSLPYRITFSGSISVRAATNGRILDYLMDAGMEQLGIGFESADAEQLRRYNKQQTLEENYIAAKNVVDRGINLIPGLITFDPFATTETIRNNLSFLFDHLHHYELGKLTKRLYILTGTSIARLIERNGLLIGDYLNYDYRFQHSEVEALYHDFQEYTNMAKDIQKQINRAGLSYNKSIGVHHRNVAEKILSKEPWRPYAIQELEAIKREMEGLVK